MANKTMKTLSVILIGLVPYITSAQKLINVETPIIEQGVETYELIDVNAKGHALVKYTKYYEDNTIQQDGYYLNGKVHGTWNMYDPRGKNVHVVKYDEPD